MAKPKKNKPVQLGTPSPELEAKLKELKDKLAADKQPVKKKAAEPKTPRQKAESAAATEVRKERKGQGRRKDSSTVAPKKDAGKPVTRKLVDPKRLEQEYDARERIADEQEKFGDLQVSDALRRAEGDYGPTVDETDDEDRGIAGASDVAGILRQTENEAQSYINRGSSDPAANPVLDRPRPESPRQRGIRLRERAAAARVSGRRRAEDARSAVTPTFGPPRLRHVIGYNEDPADFGLTEDQVVRGPQEKVGTVTAVRQDRGASVPLDETALANSEQFWGLDRRSEDARPETVLDTVDGKLKGFKGLPETRRESATVKSQENKLERERRSVENDIKLANDLIEVGKSIPASVTESIDPILVGGASSVRADVKDTVKRPGTAADIDPGSTAATLLRNVATGTVSGFGEMSRAGQKAPGGSGGTAPGVKQKQTSDTSTEAGRALNFFRRTLTSGQFQELHDFAKSAAGELEKMPTEWTPEMGLPSAEGVPYGPIIGEKAAREVAEAGASSPDARRRSVPVVTEPASIEGDADAGMQALIGRVNDSGIFSQEDLAQLATIANSPKSRLRTPGVVTAPPRPYSGATSPEDQQRIKDVADQPGSPATVRDAYKGMRQDLDQPIEGKGTTDKAILQSSTSGGLRRGIAEMMERFLGDRSGGNQRGAAVGSAAGQRLAMQDLKKRPGRSVRVTNVNDRYGNPLASPQSVPVPTGQPVYTDKEIGKLRKVNPELADLVNPTSDVNTARSGRMTEAGLELARAGESVPSEEITWSGPRGVANPRARLQGTDASGAPAATRVRSVKVGAQRTVARAAINRSEVPAPPKYDTKSGSYFPLTPGQASDVAERLQSRFGRNRGGSEPTQENVLEPFEAPPAPVGTLYLGSQFRESRVVQPGESSGVFLDENSNPVVTNPGRLAATPAGRRALNAPLRTRQIAEAKKVSLSQKALDPESIAANEAFDRRNTRRRGIDTAKIKAQRFRSAPIEAEDARFRKGPTVASSSTGAEAPSPFTASRTGMFIQAPSVERAVNPVGAHLYDAYARYKGIEYGETRPPVGDEKAQSETVTGSVREMTGRAIAKSINPYATSAGNMFKPAPEPAAPFRGAQSGRLSHFGTSIRSGPQGATWQETAMTGGERSRDSLAKATVADDDIEGRQTSVPQAINRGWKTPKKPKK